MYRSLSSFVPNVADLLDLAVEELAGILLLHLNSYEGVSGNTVHQNGGISRHNFFNSLTPTNAREQPEYGNRQSDVNMALMEAWAWLQSAGLLVEKPNQAARWRRRIIAEETNDRRHVANLGFQVLKRAS